MFIWLVAAALAVMLAAPHSSAGRALRRTLVEIPAERLNRVRRGHLILAALVLAAAALALMAGREALTLYAPYQAELVGWFAAFDIATYVDVFAAAVIVAAAVRLKSAMALARLALEAVRRRRNSASAAQRGRSLRRKRNAPPADSEGEPWPAALAVARGG
jgi:hypothetical protein